MVSPAGFHQGTDMTLALNFDKENEIKDCFKSLSEGGEIIEDLKDAPWGAIFEVAQNKFGKAWKFNCEKK